MRIKLLHQLQIGLTSTFLLLGLPLFADAQEASALQSALNRCYAITAIAVRVNCYDELVRAGQTNTTQSAAVTPSTPQSAAAASESSTPPPAETADIVPVSETPTFTAPAAIAAPVSVDPVVAEFGQQAKVVTGNAGEVELVDTVAAVKRVEPTKLQISLVGGQIWRQTIGKSFLIRKGETVRIRTSGWGAAYRLSVEGRSEYIQVSRQQ